MSRILQLSFSVLLTIVLISCKQDVAPKNEDFKVVVRIDRDLPRISPIFATSSRERELYPYLFLNLASHDAKTLELSPVLAESLPEKTILNDGRISYAYRILDDAAWSDGKPITAADFLFTYKAVSHPEVLTASWKTVVSTIDEIVINKEDPKAITYIVKEEGINTVEAISSMEVYPEHIYDSEGVLANYSLSQMRDEDFTSTLGQQDSTFGGFAAALSSSKFGREIVEGAGPYSLKAWESDQYIHLERKSNWWGSKYPERTALQAGPSEIIFQIIADQTTALTQLKGGNIDVMKLTDGTSFNNLQEEFKDDFWFSKPSINQYFYLAINNGDKIMQHKEVRQAIAYAVDVPKIISVLESGDATPISSSIAPFVSAFNSDIPIIKHNINKAVAVLEDKGWSDSNNNGVFDKMINGQLTELSIEMLASSDKSEKLALLVKENAKKAGVEINITRKKFSLILNDHVYKGNYQMFPMSSSWDLNPYDPYSRWHSDNAVAKGGNLSYYKNEKVDQIITTIRKEVNGQNRLNLYTDFDKLLSEDQPVVFLYRPLARIVTNKRLKPLTADKRPGYFINAYKLSEVPAFSSN